MDTKTSELIRSALERCSPAECGRIARAFYVLSARLEQAEDKPSQKIGAEFYALGVRAESIRDDDLMPEPQGESSTFGIEEDNGHPLR